MHEITFVQDMAVIMLVAGFVTVVFHYFNQPVVLGYLLAGIIVGPHTPPFAFIKNSNTVEIFSELGVIFLIFFLGLEFSLSKLKKVGLPALVSALLEILVMVGIGYAMGRAFHWSSTNALFLGAILAISSTTIIIKVLTDLRLQKKYFAQLIFGILIVEDILGIAILALLSGLALSHSVGAMTISVTLAKLVLFLVVSLTIGIFIIPKVIGFVAQFQNKEMLLITVLGICFGFCLLVLKLNYSIVLGAFIIGAIIAESGHLPLIQKLILPIRNMFSAIFFVAIGMMLDPKLLVPFIGPIILITIAVIVGKVVTCSLGAFITGQSGKTSLKVGMGLAQIGEFSFIIATLGTSLKITSNFLFPIAVGVSMITTLTTPYLIRASDPLARWLARSLPTSAMDVLKTYTSWLQNIKLTGDGSFILTAIKKGLILIFINLCLVAAIFLTFSYVAEKARFTLTNIYFYKSILWGTALIISVPFLIAVYRKIKALSMILAEASVQEKVTGRFTTPVRRVISEFIPLTAMVMVLFFIFALSASILPPSELLFLVLAIVALITFILYHWFVKLHSNLQLNMIETLKKSKEKSDDFE